uniref:Uncharacterized protein n=1 Tax=viral metagenome TaxID=1070528 RepID=A0A6C0CSM7_9ZZZZ
MSISTSRRNAHVTFTGSGTNGYTMFNRVYDEFILKVRELFPQYKKLEFYYQLFLNIRVANHKLPARLFASSVAEHSLNIFNKNEDYFLSGVKVTKTRERAMIEETLIEEWRNMTHDQKEIIWFFLQNMLLLIMGIEEDDEEDDNLNTAEIDARRVLGLALEKDGVHFVEDSM